MKSKTSSEKESERLAQVEKEDNLKFKPRMPFTEDVKESESLIFG